MPQELQILRRTPDPESLAEILSALSSEVRLRILDAIARKEIECRDDASCDLSDRCCSVSELSAKVGVDLPSASRHLKELRNVGLLVRRRSGRQVFYELERERFDLLVMELARFGNGEGFPDL